MRTESQRDVIGSPIEDLDTPALLLDGPASDRNLARMAEFFRGRAAQLRPHFKNHKCVTLARRQLAAGSAVGMTCAKLGEAEVLAAAGFADLLVANQVVGRRKIARLVAAAQRTKLRVAVDDLDNCREISAAASAAGATVGLLIEINGGMGRCGVSPGEPARELARAIAKLPGVRLDGLQCFEGHCVYVDDRAERERQAVASMRAALDTRELIERDGIPLAILSGGASSTYQAVGALAGVDEVQAGTYPTMDWRYGELIPEFEVALSILTRVISNLHDRVVVDSGVKGAGAEFGPPRVKNRPGVELPFFKSEEHGILLGAGRLPVGAAVELIPSHACTTCNLYREIIVHDAGRVVNVWPIEAAGRLA